ncbi:unnamed protein product [Mytilus coruscus]|uniref:Uncharacterized protein n=1 Tax=Mytilus coruscus TaxID=42192 RepID=A0A6J8DGQ8_MYTCO|nr:unnamed protein product [Mytilus coruscus]
MAYYLDGFFWDKSTYPDLVCELGFKRNVPGIFKSSTDSWRRNSKKKADKESGRKLPRLDDAEQDVTAAHDSTFINQSDKSITETPNLGPNKWKEKSKRRVKIVSPCFQSTIKRKTVEVAEDIEELMTENEEERFHQSSAASPFCCPTTDINLQTGDFGDLMHCNAQKFTNDKYQTINGLEPTVFVPYFEEKGNTWNH